MEHESGRRAAGSGAVRPTRSARTERLLLILLLVATFFSYALTIQPGHEWGDDFAMYVREAQNIVHGTDYKTTGYLFDITNPALGPRFTPPVFPLLIAPVVAIFGINLTALRVEIVLFFVLFLAALYAAFRKSLPYPYLLGALFFLAACPTFWMFKNHVLSDIPFLLLAILAMSRIQSAYDEGKWRLRDAVPIGILLYISCGARMVGIVLIPSLFVMDLVRRRKLTAFPWVALAAFAVLYGIQKAVIRGPDGYINQFSFSFARVLENVRQAKLDFFGTWNNTVSRPLGVIFKAILLALAAIGLMKRTRRGITIYEIFIPIYLVLVSIWTWDKVRYVLPVLPLFAIYVFIGAVAVVERLHAWPWMRWALPIFLVVGVGASYASTYATMSLAPVEWGADTPKSRELYAYVRSNTPKDAVLLFFKPRALALYTERRVSTYPRWIDDAYVERLISRIGASYVIEIPAKDAAWSYVRHHPGETDSLWTNGAFTVFRLRRQLPAGAPRS